MPVAQAVLLQESGRFQFYVEQAGLTAVDLTIVRTKNGAKYLRTKADKRSPNNLGRLPESVVR